MKAPLLLHILIYFYCVFQKKDGVPVYLKGGPVDKVLFGITLALCVYGTAASLQMLYVLSYPKKA
jgi:hypothetical protein